MSGSHHQITDIHNDRTFQQGRLYNEHFSCFVSEAEEWKRKALVALRRSAKAIIPANLMKNVVFSSIDTYGRRIFSWRFGADWWINETTLGKGWNRQVYE